MAACCAQRWWSVLDDSANTTCPCGISLLATATGDSGGVGGMLTWQQPHIRPRFWETDMSSQSGLVVSFVVDLLPLHNEPAGEMELDIQQI